MTDLISRQAAIEEFDGVKVNEEYCTEYDIGYNDGIDFAVSKLSVLPSAEPTLYGYKIEHLAYIARVMEKEGVTADYAVRTFDDMSRALKMIIDEIQQKVEEALNERSNQQTVGD